MTASRLDALVSDARLVPSGRALLLLRVCHMAQAFRPDVLPKYWEQLKGLSKHLPASSRESFDGLHDSIEPPAPAELGGFGGSIVAALEEARRSGSHEVMLRALADCQRRITGRLWPSGKSAAWEALVRAWIDVDREGAFPQLHRLKAAAQSNLLVRENDRSPLSPTEWSTARAQVPAAVRGAIDVILDRDEPRLELPTEVAEATGQALVEDMFRGGADDREAEARREAARQRLLKLVKLAGGPTPELATRLLQRWFTTTAETVFFSERWLSRFFALFRVVGTWCSYPSLAPGLMDFLKRAPAHLRSAVLAHAAALQANTPAEADAAWAAVEGELTDKGPAEHWFLLTLLRAGMPEHALEMARRSARAEQIVPCLRRAWLYEHPDSARAAIAAQDLAGDEIAEFLHNDREGRVEFLRKRTDNGQLPLPANMWKAPDLGDIIAEIGGRAGTARNAAMGTWYAKTVKPEEQFAIFVRISGYGQHLYENLDPILLASLAAWDEAHPEEAGRVTRKMWETMQGPLKAHVRMDLVRNDIVERCQAVLGAHPVTAGEFMQWIRSELVQKQVREQVGTTIYTFQLNDNAPFLYGLVIAEKLAKVSARRCDEVLTIAVGDYTASDALMTAAAQLYASDKGMSGLEPPVALKQPSQLGAWQAGVVQAAFKEILAALVVDGEQAPVETAPARTAAAEAPPAQAPAAQAGPAEEVGWFEVEVPSGIGLCSDNDCPCSETVIPRGTGYIYISKEVVEFRRDCPTIAQAQEKIDRIRRDAAALTGGGSVVLIAPGVAAPILVCEEGAKLRQLDMDVAAADARQWWATGRVPLRPTPIRAGERQAPVAPSGEGDEDAPYLTAAPIERSRMDLLWLDPPHLTEVEAAIEQQGVVTVVLGDDSEMREHSFTRDDLLWARQIEKIVDRAYTEGQSGRYAESLGFYQEALRAAPGCDLFLMSAGVCLARLGQPARGLRYLQRAAEISPGNNRIRENLRQVAGMA